jgi:hypothetical protein
MSFLRRGAGTSDLRPYATNLHDRMKVAGWLMLLSAGLSVALTLGAHRMLVEQQANGPSIWLFVPLPSFAAVFTIVLKLYDERLWRSSLAGKRWSPIPNLNGAWVGYVTVEGETRAEEPQGEIPCRVEIDQSWSRISLDFETDFTTSTLVMAAINRGRGIEGGFQYEYIVSPKPGTELERTGMRLHLGMARLTWDDPDPDCLEGSFFNGSGYQRYGQYHLERDSSGRTASQWRGRNAQAPRGGR